MLWLQLEHPTKGDWGSTCKNYISELHINLAMDEIKLISKAKFTRMLKEKTEGNAFPYLMGKCGKKM